MKDNQKCPQVDDEIEIHVCVQYSLGNMQNNARLP